jgi:cysteine sulfinate desulfinase/cysteine desulfurase-like protein
MMVNNETGVTLPVLEAAATADRRGGPFRSDAGLVVGGASSGSICRGDRVREDGP